MAGAQPLNEVDFPYSPDWGAQKKTSPRIVTSDFGENYSQRMSVGINVVPKTLPLTFSNRTDDDADAIEAFFDARRGVVPFTYAHGSGPIKKYITVGDWIRTYVEFNRNTVSVTFKETQ